MRGYLIALTAFSLAASVFAGPKKSSKSRWTADQNDVLAAFVKDIKNLQRQTNSLPPNQKARTATEIENKIDSIANIGRQNGDIPEAQVRVADALNSVGRPSRALPFADRGVELAPEDPEARLTRGHIRYALNQFEGAADDAREALRLNPGNRAAQALLKLSEDRVARGSAHARPHGEAGLSTAGESGGTEATAIPSGGTQGGPGKTPIPPTTSPESVRARTLVREAAAKMDLGDFPASLKAADRALALDPRNASAYLHRSAVHLQMKRYTEAAADASKAIDLGLRNAVAYNARSLAYVRGGKYREALDDAESAMQHDPKNAGAYYHRALAREGLRSPKEEILQDYKAAAALDPRYEPRYQEALALHAHPPTTRSASPDGSAGALWLIVALLAGALGTVVYALSKSRRTAGSKQP